MCSAAVKISVESVVESLVSRYEKHYPSSRQMAEEHTLEEMSLSENGPLLHQAESILKRAMDNYWKGGPWHFKWSYNIKEYTGGSSKVIGRMIEQQ